MSVRVGSDEEAKTVGVHRCTRPIVQSFPVGIKAVTVDTLRTDTYTASALIATYPHVPQLPHTLSFLTLLLCNVCIYISTNTRRASPALPAYSEGSKRPPMFGILMNNPSAYQTTQPRVSTQYATCAYSTRPPRLVRNVVVVHAGQAHLAERVQRVPPHNDLADRLLMKHVSKPLYLERVILAHPCDLNRCRLEWARATEEVSTQLRSRTWCRLN